MCNQEQYCMRLGSIFFYYWKKRGKLNGRFTLQKEKEAQIK